MALAQIVQPHGLKRPEPPASSAAVTAELEVPTGGAGGHTSRPMASLLSRAADQVRGPSQSLRCPVALPVPLDIEMRIWDFLPLSQVFDQGDAVVFKSRIARDKGELKCFVLSAAQWGGPDGLKLCERLLQDPAVKELACYADISDAYTRIVKKKMTTQRQQLPASWLALQTSAAAERRGACQ